ncbi:hypothetical protein [uncultured Dokdonia sp.]|uniref:hypothetical protein n=1 Tax=uncultured Dokdonia sp. TaxID=575653 RepID=UPI0026147759|nr:hypothetical protein [uncultured Dokdonia sp.]
MKINIEFIQQQFENIAQQYKLKWINITDWTRELINDKVRLSFGTERWEDGMTVTIENEMTNDFYYINHIEEILGFEVFGNEFFTSEDNIYYESLTRGNDKIVFYFRILLERYCQKALSGDFSELGPRDQ